MRNKTKGTPKPKKEKKGIRPWLVTILSIAFVVAIGALAWLQMRNYEQGVLDVYATQQDGFVQLVLDQIHIAEKRGADAKEIEEILATLDASTNRFWTLSSQGSLIFVKDVMETNRYQGFTTASYYQTVSAQEFISTLEVDDVIHRTIQMGEQSYIASGVQFTFHGTPYRVCLLTNVYTILDHNAYLSAKIYLVTLALIALLTFVLAVEALAAVAGHYRRKYIQEMEDNNALRRQTETLNDALQKADLYDARRTAYTAKALPMLWEKLEARDPWPLSLMLLRCAGEEAQHQFLQFTQLQMNHKVLRAFLDQEHILLILLRVDGLELDAVRDGINLPDVTLVGEDTLTQHPQGALEDYVNRFVERTLEDEKQASL